MCQALSWVQRWPETEVICDFPNILRASQDHISFESSGIWQIEQTNMGSNPSFPTERDIRQTVHISSGSSVEVETVVLTSEVADEWLKASVTAPVPGVAGSGRSRVQGFLKGGWGVGDGRQTTTRLRGRGSSVPLLQVRAGFYIFILGSDLQLGEAEKFTQTIKKELYVQSLNVLLFKVLRIMGHEDTLDWVEVIGNLL